MNFIEMFVKAQKNPEIEYRSKDYIFTAKNGLYDIDTKERQETNLCFPDIRFLDGTPWIEYEPKVNWSSIPVDTLIEVYQLETQKWIKRYFAGMSGNGINAWKNGATSHTAKNKNDFTTFPKARLVKL